MGSPCRSPREVLDDHLSQARENAIESDMMKNYAEDVVLLTGYGVYHGYSGIRYLADLLKHQLPEARFEYRTVQVENDVGFLEWKAEAANGAHVEDGADSFVIRDGRIVAQTIHYTVDPPSGL